jgi:hypothetical protein
MSDQATIKVRATQLGYYEHKRRREGDVFVLVPRTDRFGNVMTAKSQFSKKWMEMADPKAPESVSTMLKVTPSNLQDHLDKNMPIHPAPEQIRFEAGQAKNNQEPTTMKAAQEQSTSQEEVI